MRKCCDINNELNIPSVKKRQDKRVMSNTDGQPPLCTGAPQAQQQPPHTTTDRHGAMTHFATTHIKCVCSGYLA